MLLQIASDSLAEIWEDTSRALKERTPHSNAGLVGESEAPPSDQLLPTSERLVTTDDVLLTRTEIV